MENIHPRPRKHRDTTLCALVFFGPRGHHLVDVLRSALRRFLRAGVRPPRGVVRRAGAAAQPRVHQQLRRRQPLGGRLPEHAADQALGPGRQPLGHAEGAAADLGEQRGGLRVLERVPSDQHGVQGHAQAPDVGGAARVGPAPVGQQLRADVGGAAVSVRQRVVAMVAAQDNAVVEAEQSEARPAGGREGPQSVSSDLSSVISTGVRSSINTSSVNGLDSISSSIRVLACIRR